MTLFEFCGTISLLGLWFAIFRISNRLESILAICDVMLEFDRRAAQRLYTKDEIDAVKARKVGWNCAGSGKG